MQNVSQFRFLWIGVMSFSWCSGAPCLVILAQNSTNSEDPVFIASPLWHVLLVPPSTGNHKGKCPTTGAVGSQSLSHVRRLVWPAALKNKKRYKLCARAQHVQCAPQFHFFHCFVTRLSNCANVPSIVSIPRKFTNSKDAMLKKFPPPSGTCCLCR